jgi:hypothetical protein
MKVAISLPDPVFQAAEQLARRQHKPRSRLYAEAIAEYVDAHDSSDVTKRLNAVYGAEDSSLDEGLQRIQSKTLGNEAW